MVTISAVWDRTTAFIADNLAAIMPIALLALFVPTSLQTNLSQLALTASPGLKLGLALVQLLLWLLILWGELAIAAMVVGARGASPVAIATRRLLPAIGVLVVGGMIVLLLLVPMVLVAGVSGVALQAFADPQTMTLPPGSAGAILIALMITVPVVLWLMARMYVLLTAVVVAERLGLGAIPRSFALTRGLALRIVGVIVLYVIVSGVAVLATRTVFGSIFALVVSDEGTVSLARILTSIFAGAVSTGFTVLAMVFCATLYRATSGQDDPTLP